LPQGNESGKDLPLSNPISVGISEALEKNKEICVTALDQSQMYGPLIFNLPVCASKKRVFWRGYAV
jgi:hypothetical protein